MKIRIIGSADLVERASKVLRAAGVPAKMYPSRYSTAEMRLYCDVDDRAAAELLSEWPSREPRIPAPKRRPHRRSNAG